MSDQKAQCGKARCATIHILRGKLLFSTAAGNRFDNSIVRVDVLRPVHG